MKNLERIKESVISLNQWSKQGEFNSNLWRYGPKTQNTIRQSYRRVISLFTKKNKVKVEEYLICYISSWRSSIISEIISDLLSWRKSSPDWQLPGRASWGSCLQMRFSTMSISPLSRSLTCSLRSRTLIWGSEAHKGYSWPALPGLPGSPCCVDWCHPLHILQKKFIPELAKKMVKEKKFFQKLLSFISQLSFISEEVNQSQSEFQSPQLQAEAGGECEAAPGLF